MLQGSYVHSREDEWKQARCQTFIHPECGNAVIVHGPQLNACASLLGDLNQSGTNE